MKYYVVKYFGPFGFIKPWTAVRDANGGETFSQQFLTPSIIEGIRQKLGVSAIERHKLIYAGMDVQQEVIQGKAWDKKGKQCIKNRSILKRGIMIYPILYLAFNNNEDALQAGKQHICLCRNEDILLPVSSILEISVEEFDRIEGYELRFGKQENSFLVGYNRFEECKEMYGYIEIMGNPIHKEFYE